MAFAGAQPALARGDGGSRPALAACVSTPHFVIHCDTPGSSQQATQSGKDFEEAYGHDVAGGGLSPNAGLRPPVPDDDGKTDIYLTPDVSGGQVLRDSTHTSDGGQAAFILMRSGTDRFRAGHEFMHVLQIGYFGAYPSPFQEGLANWAAEWALADVDPLNSNFVSPELPFDCTYGTWPPGGSGRQCGNGYNQWLFFQRQVEDFGVGFISSYYERARSIVFAPGAGPDWELQALMDELAARTGLPPGQALGSRFHDYALKIWDPFAWSTTAVNAIFEYAGPPSSNPYKLKRTRDTGTQVTTVDHLAARYVTVSNADPRRGDRLRFTVTPPQGLVGPPNLLVGAASSSYVPPEKSPQVVPLTADGAGNLTATVASGPADPSDVAIALVNDTTAADGLQFSYRAELLRLTGKLSVHRQRLAVAFQRGLEVELSCTEDCTARVSLQVSRAEAGRLGLVGGGSPQRRAKSVTVGKTRARLAAGEESATVKFTRRARMAIAEAGGVHLTAKGTFSSASGGRDSSSAAVKLRR